MAHSLPSKSSRIVTLGNTTFIEIDPRHWSKNHSLYASDVSMISALTGDHLQRLVHPLEAHLQHNPQLGIKASNSTLTESQDVFTCKNLLHLHGAWATLPVYFIHFNGIHAIIHFHEICSEPTPKRHFIPLLRFCTEDDLINTNLPAYRLPTDLFNKKFQVIFDMFELRSQRKLPMN